MSKPKPQSDQRTVSELTLSKAEKPHADGPAKLDRRTFPHKPSSPNRSIPATYENFLHLLASHDIRVRFNRVKKRADVFIPGIDPARQNRDEVVLAHLESLMLRNEMSPALVRRYLLAAADADTYDPFADWIESRPWDGVSRVSDLCATIQTAEDYPEELRDTLIRKWLLSAVAASFHTKGFRARGVLTLQGGQGIGKTTWLANLVSCEALREDVVKLGHSWDGGNKDSRLNAIRHRIVELGEIEGSFRREMAGLKAFITETTDKIRPPYGRVEAEYPRSTIFGATVNERQYLIDRTGNSRFWTVAVSSIDFDHGIDMQQLFAELKVQFDAGEQWWLSDVEEEALAKINDLHRDISAIEAKIAEAIDVSRRNEPGLPRLTANEVLEHLGFSAPGNAQSKEANVALRGLLGQSRRSGGYNRWAIPWKSAAAKDAELYPELPETY